MKYINPVILGMKDYDVPHYKGFTKLNQNEVPEDYPRKLKEQIFEELRKEPWNRYPDNKTVKLTKRVAEYSGVNPSNVICSNGSNELIQSLIAALPLYSRKILVNTPSFSMYERVGSIFGGEIIKVPLKSDFSFDIENIIKMSKGVSLITLVSPNNPTGTVLKRPGLIKILNSIKAPILLDEAYFEFYPNDNVNLIKRYPNLLILRTFSKAFASASMRVGYMIGNEKLIKEIRKTKLPFSVGLFQQIAANIALQNKEIFQKKVSELIIERERVKMEIEKTPSFEVIKSYSNFLMFRSLRIKSETIYNRLLSEKILIRSYTESILTDWLRVSIGTSKENNAFIDSINKI